MSNSHRDVLAGTIAELSWLEVERAAREDAVLLWAFGVIEQHGPHLPSGTDVYLPAELLRQVRSDLHRRGVPALIVPPCYWGVNVVSGSFPASYGVRPEVLQGLMVDVFAGFAQDGFTRVFCFSGHGDALHNRTVHAGVRLGVERTGMSIRFVVDRSLAARIGVEPDDPHVAVFEPVPHPAHVIDVHAGRWETSAMAYARPDLVRGDVADGLAATGFQPADLAEWRRGYEHARRKAPLGYVGDPATATSAEGASWMQGTAERAVDAILAGGPMPATE
jgi:creatinine amidohydrolase/Fe(II)-dependent formamide hydrolase-like protein